MKIFTRNEPKSNRNTEKFLLEWKSQSDEEWPEKKFGEFDTFRCIPCTKSEDQLSNYMQEKQNP